MKDFNKLEISIVICTLNRSNSLIKTIENIFLGNCIPSEVIIIDQSNNNQSEIAIQNFANNIGKDLIKYIRQELPSSTKARNTGMELCENEIIIFMDDDVDVNKDTIKAVWDNFTEKKISMIAGIDELERKSDNIFGYFFGTKSLKKKNIGHVTKSMLGRFPTNQNLNQIVETQWAMGYFFAVRKSIIDKWNLCWDETLSSYAYAEDLDFSYTYYKISKKQGYKCIITPEVKVKHNCSREWRVSSKKSIYMYVINREYLSSKHSKGLLGGINTRWTNIGVLLQRIAKKDNPHEFLKALYHCEKYRKDIKKGNLHHELYMD